MNPNIGVGEIWLISLNDAQGHEQNGTRPGLVLAIHSETKLVMVTPYTGNLEATRFPYSHRINRSVLNGLTFDSVALIFQTRCLTDTRFIKKLGDLGTNDFDLIQILLRTYFGI